MKIRLFQMFVLKESFSGEDQFRRRRTRSSMKGKKKGNDSEKKSLFRLRKDRGGREEFKIKK